VKASCILHLDILANEEQSDASALQRMQLPDLTYDRVIVQTDVTRNNTIEISAINISTTQLWIDDGNRKDYKMSHLLL
jgi:hypothetical protein